MSLNKKVSVIVPVYNVQDYLERCIDSLVKQTYKNIEIILVDDGSTDNSGKICDDYKKIYKNIIVVHKENEGQSIAREYGIKISKGEYLSFVDSDDFLDEKFYEEMTSLLERNNCDIAVCDYRRFSDNQSKFINKSKENYYKLKKTISNREAVKLIIQRNNRITNYLWNKLYRREVFQNIMFPKFNIYEDLAIMYLILDNARKVVITNEKLYYYFERKNSSSKSIPSKFIINKIKITSQREKFLLKKGYKLSNELLEYRFFSDYNNFKIIARNRDKKTFFGKIMKKELSFMKDFYIQNKNIINLNYKELICLRLLIFNWKLYYMIVSIFKYK